MILRKENSNLYTKKLPVVGVSQATLKTGVELLQLQAGKRKWTIGNLELRAGLPLFIYSPSSQKYWYRILGADHDLTPYRKYISDGNLYIYFNDQWKEKVRQEVESEGMGYFKYNRLRHLILLDELLDSNREDEKYQYKKRALQIEMDKINKS